MLIVNFNIWEKDFSWELWNAFIIPLPLVFPSSHVTYVNPLPSQFFFPLGQTVCCHATLMFIACVIGDLWFGSEGGVIKVWYGEAIEKSLNLQREEKRKTSFLVERSSTNLRAMVNDGGACPLPAVDVKLLLSDNSRSKVWSAGYLSFALWYTSCVHLSVIVAFGWH